MMIGFALVGLLAFPVGGWAGFAGGDMYGIDSLKQKLVITETSVSCPVRGCAVRVARQRGGFRRERKYLCPEHGIYVSPTTFEYANEARNLLWNKPADMSLLAKIGKVKHEGRFGRDNSEDALTWNLFRYMQNEPLAGKLFGSLMGSAFSPKNYYYWTYDQEKDSVWQEIKSARIQFGESPTKGSEPDMIVVSSDTLVIIEAKLTSGNNVPGSDKEISRVSGNSKKYLTGGGRWFDKVFSSGYEAMIRDQKYELFRYWLLGTYIAESSGLNFYLISLVPENKETDIEAAFGKHIKQAPNRKFIRVTWESFYKAIKNSCPESDEKKALMNYFRNKAVGYRGGELQKAFSAE